MESSSFQSPAGVLIQRLLLGDRRRLGDGRWTAAVVVGVETLDTVGSGRGDLRLKG